MTVHTLKKQPDIDYKEIEWLFDKCKSKVFMGKGSGFLGAIMSKLNFYWDEGISTACTNGVSIKWNPYFFLKCSPEMRVTVLKHELWHVAYLDCIRRGSRKPDVWNYACDYRINNGLDYDGDKFDSDFKPYLDHKFDGLSPEEIYDIIDQDDIKRDGDLDLNEPGEPSDDFPDPVDRWQVINTVIGASQAAKMGGGAGDIPGEIETVLSRFLSPKLPWNQLLFNFFNEKSVQDYSFRKPNRRIQNIYLPTLVDDDGGLDHMMFFGDVSGSVSDSEFIRYISEVKYIKDHFDPEQLTFVQFDTVIQSIKTWDQSQPFDEVVRKGYGGTDLRCVRKLILEHKPSAVVVLSDLCCTPMVEIGSEFKVPILWVAVNNMTAQVNEGKLIYMRE